MRRLVLLLALAGCGAPGTGPAPQGGGDVRRVVLYRDTVTVEVGRTLCTGPRTAPGTRWSGTLAGCPSTWPYAVEQPAAAYARLPLRPGEGGAGRVTLTRPDGRAEVWTGPR